MVAVASCRRLLLGVSTVTPSLSREGSESTVDPDDINSDANPAQFCSAASEPDRLNEYLAHAQDILLRIDDENVPPMTRLTLLREAADETGDNFVARMLYIDLIATASDDLPPEHVDGELNAQGSERLQGVIEQGEQLVANLPLQQALSVLNSVHRAAKVSLIASVLYLHMLLSSKEGNGDDAHMVLRHQMTRQLSECRVRLHQLVASLRSLVSRRARGGVGAEPRRCCALPEVSALGRPFSSVSVPRNLRRTNFFESRNRYSIPISLDLSTIQARPKSISESHFQAQNRQDIWSHDVPGWLNEISMLYRFHAPRCLAGFGLGSAIQRPFIQMHIM